MFKSWERADNSIEVYKGNDTNGVGNIQNFENGKPSYAIANIKRMVIVALLITHENQMLFSGNKAIQLMT